MLILQRMTVQYIDIEDRIRFTGEPDANERVVMWVTYRLLANLLPACVAWLEGREERHLAHGSMMSFEQEAARTALQRQEPVIAPEAAAGWLVHAIDISQTTEMMQMIFKGQHETQRASLTLSPLALRQWLAILQDQCRAGGWNQLQWPSWMDVEPEMPIKPASWLN